MSEVLKTTVYLDAGDYRRLKSIARAKGRAPAELVREAVSEYAKRHGPRRLPRTIGIARSAKGDLSERVDELLKGFGE